MVHKHSKTAGREFAVFSTSIPVQPRDIDINGHVHHSVYLDYFIAARFDQMKRCYKMSMDDIMDMGFSFVARKYELQYKMPLMIGDTAVVKTWVMDMGRLHVDVGFSIESAGTGSVAARGGARFVLIDSRVKKAVPIPRNIRERYSIVSRSF